jgi:quinol monooxygenase YgiN
MSDQPVLLTVRGTAIPKTLEAMRVLHNETAGSPAGIAAARALGDLSHMVYAPAKSPLSKAVAGELLFLDVWVHPKGIMDFFSNPQVQEQGGKLFSARDASVWAPAAGAFTYQLPAPRTRRDRFVGIIRGPIAGAEKAVETIRDADAAAQRDARRRGILSHEVFIKLGEPAELLAMDVWTDLAGMAEHYADASHMTPIRSVFTGPPQPSVWEPAAGEWSEW